MTGFSDSSDLSQIHGNKNMTFMKTTYVNAILCYVGTLEMYNNFYKHRLYVYELEVRNTGTV